MRIYFQKIFFFFLIFNSFYFCAHSQTLKLRGKIFDENGKPALGATIKIIELTKGTVTNDSGKFEIEIPSQKKYTVEISFLGYDKIIFPVDFSAKKDIYIEKKLELAPERIDEVYIEGNSNRAGTFERIDIISLDRIPTTSGGIEALLPSFGGVNMRGSEFSSQYSVRGGNYDENLVYINEVEIYRSLLIKAGQQEGLSIINPDLVSSVQFSAGGFDAHYGDKMSSVLDIKYKRPSGFGGSISGSLLGASSSFEMASKDKKFTGIAGVRYKSNKYLLNKLKTKGDYKPTFLDFQSFFTYDISKKFEITLLTNISRNSYNIVPNEGQVEFGNLLQAFKYNVYYEGQELDRFTNYLGALTFHFHHTEKLSLKLITSGFRTEEEITFDILGQYSIDIVDKSEDKDSSINLGIGTYLRHARDFLNASIYSTAFKGTYFYNDNELKWGVQFQTETIEDKIKEWEMIDSAGYSVPYSKNQIPLNKTTVTDNNLITSRLTGYFQNTFDFAGKFAEYYLTTGIRAHYWSLNNQVLISPRIVISFHPYRNKNMKYHAAFGYYYQPPFYKELRDPEGVLYKNTKAQKSIHYLIGNKYEFMAWERPFIFSTEIYYKHLWNLIPYKVDDVDIQYLPQYTARGYAAGIEFKINGEFVETAESWATLSLLRAREDIYRDYYLLEDKTVVSPGYYRRPTDQTINFGLFFQDYLPTNPDYKFHINMLYGSRIPYGLPTYDIPSENTTLKPYQRVDLGLSKSLMKINAFKNFKDVWFNIEIFNLFGNPNQASYNWVKTINDEAGFSNIIGVPNLLTGRIFNVKLSAKF